MKKIIILLFLGFFCFPTFAQKSNYNEFMYTKEIADLGFIASSLALKHYNIAEDDKNLHYNIGYWGFKTCYNLLGYVKIKKYQRILISWGLLIGGAFIKEFTDPTFELLDIGYTGLGTGLCLLTYTFPLRKKKNLP